jgi:hypothetical protein
LLAAGSPSGVSVASRAVRLRGGKAGGTRGDPSGDDASLNTESLADGTAVFRLAIESDVDERIDSSSAPPLPPEPPPREELMRQRQAANPVTAAIEPMTP